MGPPQKSVTQHAPGYHKAGTFCSLLEDLNVVLSIPPINKGDVVDAFRSLSHNKAMGVDRFSARIFKIAAPAIADSVRMLLNRSIQVSEFPKRWKIARMNPLFKSSDRDDKNNYRPISILPVLSKILERRVHTHFYDNPCDNNLLYVRQPVFRRHH